jgi:hypothetical protein
MLDISNKYGRGCGDGVFFWNVLGMVLYTKLPLGLSKN